MPIVAVVNPSTVVSSPVASIPVNTTTDKAVPATKVVPEVFNAPTVMSLEQLAKFTEQSKANTKAAEIAKANTGSIKFDIQESAAEDALKKAIKLLEKEKPRVCAVLRTCTIKPDDIGVVLFTESDFHKNQLDTEGEKILGLLRKALGIEINMRVEVDASRTNPNKEKIPYTPSEKFEYLANKNPLLRKLRDDFNLEVY